jgi:23S rRNA (guanosine2251-2'-O)-methyltransferase
MPPRPPRFARPSKPGSKSGPPPHARRGDAGPGSGVRLYGRHAVEAALANPARTLRRLWATPQALASVASALGTLEVREADSAQLARLTAEHVPHQGLVLECDPLPAVHIEDVITNLDRPLLVLDQVTDPHNVGAMLRSAAAFDAAALVTQDRHSPPESGALAKAASGCLELVPWVRVVNIARALETIAEAGFWRIGLAGEGKLNLGQALGKGGVCLVMGAEGEGLRANVAAHCDVLARLPISPKVESLNVSNAAAIALYAVRMRDA